MDTDLRDELRILRARAFGPEADIAQDPAALRRLRELEALAAARPAPQVDVASAAPEPYAAPAPRAAAVLEAPAVPAVAPPAPANPSSAEAAPPDTPPARRPREFSQHLRGMWALSVIAAAAVSGGLTYGLAQVTPVSTSSGAPQVATLEPSRTIDIPAGWMGAGPSSVAYEFHGLLIYESASNFGMSSNGSDCITAVAAEELPEPDADQSSYSISGNMYSGCRVGPFPATLSLFVDSGAPEDLRAEYPDRALQFVKDGDRIGVFLADG